MKSFLILLSITLCMSTLIYQNIPQYHYASLFRDEVLNIENHKSIQSFSYPDHSEIIQNIGKVSISKVTPQLNVINPEMMQFSIEDNNVFRLSFIRKEEDFTCLLMSFKCSYSINNGPTLDGLFSLYANTYSINKSYQKAEGKDYFIPKAKAEITFEIGTIAINEKILSKAAFSEILNKYITKIQSDLITKYNTEGVDLYYHNQSSQDTTKVIHFNKGTASNENTISLTQDKAPLIKDNNIIFNFNGKINSVEDIEDPLDKISNEHFIAINKKLLQTIINENLFSYKFEESQKPIDDYTLDIASAARICNELKDITDKNIVVIHQEIRKVTLDKPTFGQGTAVIRTEIIDTKERETMLSFDTELSVNFEMSIFQRGLNIRLVGSDLLINSITVNPEPLRTITDEALLKEWFLISLKIAVSKDEYNLFKYSIDLTDYFSKINTFQIEGNYVILQ